MGASAAIVDPLLCRTFDPRTRLLDPHFTGGAAAILLFACPRPKSNGTGIVAEGGAGLLSSHAGQTIRLRDFPVNRHRE